MKRILPFVALLVLVAVVASASCLLTRHYFGHPAPATPAVKTEVFEQLNLSADQEQKIDAIRAQFTARQHQCMLLMQQRNNELAAAILADRADSPRVQAAVEKIHEAMGDMQKATLNSIFAAKEVLTPAQYDKLLQLTAQQLSAAADSPCCH
ncbi:MAG: periplasmic heavy metal sensor [Verrucomicrobiales bacterium]|jgi:Spy/CpxP family protein refolding chaperone|nr:periplasmic heavy metal sensor [Verrucomicrobiales bacterium]